MKQWEFEKEAQEGFIKGLRVGGTNPYEEGTVGYIAWKHGRDMLFEMSPFDEEPQHVCGLSGYNPMIDPPCPACEAWSKNG